ncbi:hypothetical protein GCM10009634_86710 [Saccharothrix xinjiangensis]
MSTNTTPVLRVVPDPVKPRTETEEKLWRALSAHPGGTATALSTAAGIGKSTAPKILSRWERDGLVTRTAGTVDGGARPAATSPLYRTRHGPTRRRGPAAGGWLRVRCAGWSRTTCGGTPGRISARTRSARR